MNKRLQTVNATEQSESDLLCILSWGVAAKQQDCVAMEPCGGKEPASYTKHLSAGCEQTAMGGQDSQTEVKPPSDTFDAVPPEPQPSGKLKRTALRFFGGRKSICVLPNFFGGRNKNQNKCASKKGVSKSKTHDGLSKAGWEDSLGSGYVPAGDFEYHSQTPSTCCSEFGHSTGDQKSFSLPRQKKGLRGLFNSIRRHRKNRNCDLEKNEMVAMSHVCNKEVPIAQTKIDQNDTECLNSLSESNVPVSANVEDCLTIAPECINVDVIVSENNMVKQRSVDSLVGELMKGKDVVAKNDNPNKHEETLHETTEPGSLPNTNLESTVNAQLPTGSSQISLLYGDVASLKSFDSLTGCGDIIADQDDDSIAESTVSGERSRNAGKRSSCYVTYQGGGEEMATPDEVAGDYLHDLWENDAVENICYTDSQEPDFLEHSESPRMTPEEPSSSYNMDISNNSNGDLEVTETTLTSADVMTPQSDHQESVPNSDEGYYDSTTPGQDEDGRDKVDNVRTDRLPRDSYSGDALYELFEPDDSLISPPLEKSKLPDPLEFLEMPAQCSDVNAMFTPETDLMEEDRLTLIQQDLLCAELKSMCKLSKEQALFTKGRIHQDNSFQESISKVNSKTQASMKEDQVNPEALNKKENRSHAIEQRYFKACNGGNSERMSDAAFSSLASKTCQSQEMCPEQNKPQSPNLRGNHDISKETNNDLKDDQAICFSQALVDFTKQSQFYSDSNESMGGSESGSPFSQNMQSLPAIVTFDVVDIDNEGEYDQQMDMVMEEEDITSPYEVFEESYLQKDAFAECDLQMFDLYERSLLSNTWGIASLPRHLSLTRVHQSSPLAPLSSPLALNRRSRSLDTESLELEMTDMYLGSGAALASCPRTERVSKMASSLQRKNNGHISTSENGDNRNMLQSWQPDTEGTVTHPGADGKRKEQTHSLYQTQDGHVVSFSQSVSRVPNCKPQLISASKLTDRVSCNSIPQNTGPLHRPSHLPLQSESCRPQAPGRPHAHYGRSDKASGGGGEALFYTSTVDSHPYNQHSKIRPVGITHGMPHLCSESGSPVSPVDYEQLPDFTSKGRKAVEMVRPVECSKHMSGANP
ncbi:APC membrane recruitment protein 1 isoform X1 [Oncorhynchus mykiss]|uniref:APC membrane recruitment protein 1 n=1 Tax=Oncorhynchus mykiss TaxID=8022 RepID=A0A8C7V477_ONCMY|nr:APC membrane recruitment protein 1 isoform X1 [Oncorhynchus mykiss]